jgi:hypothetical protein
MDPLAHLPAPDRARVLVDGLDHPEGVAYDPDADVVCANLGRWHLTLLDLGVRGVAPHRPARWALDALAVTA